MSGCEGQKYQPRPVAAGELDGIREVFAGGGEMGALMRSLDWKRSPLGPVSGWSQALRSTVALLLRSRFPMILWWGPEFIQLYNDAYRSIPGAKHPRSMGQMARECWPEIWHVIGPMIEAPFSGRPATWSDDLFVLMHRNGFLEETHFKVACSPVPDETVRSTGIGGVLATVAETTEQVQAERQLRTLRDLGARAAEVKTPDQACETAVATLAENAFDVPFAIFYLVEPGDKTARVAASCGFDVANGAANPHNIDLRAPPEENGWPVARILERRAIEVVSDLNVKFGKVPSGRWSEPPCGAIGLPLASPDPICPYGVLIAGCNPHRALDEGYRSFFELAATQVVTAIRNAHALEEQRLRAEKLAELDRAKTAFFSNVSHEFRTPLSLMLGPVQELLSSPDAALPPQTRELLATVQRSGARLQKLVSTLLDFSRIESGRMEADYQPTELAAYTAELASNFRSSCARVGLTLNIDCPPLSEPIFVDREMWEKIVLNLLSNALKHTFEGGLTVGVKAGADRVTMSVSDTGVGIPRRELPHIFKRFHRVKDARARTTDGTGIGLALVQELARLHGGFVSVESEEREGSTFNVVIPTGSAHLPRDRIGAKRTLPSTATGSSVYIDEVGTWLPEPNAGPSARPSAPRPPISAGAYAKRPMILLADDNADMRKYVRRLLTQRWDVFAVDNGSWALEAAREWCPDLVLADVMMPGLDGFALLRELRADERTATIPVILLSARAGEEARIEGRLLGADDYLVKPCSARELLARVEAVLIISQSRRQAEQRFKSYFQLGLVGMAIMTPTKGCVDVNDELCRILGYERRELLKMTWAEMTHPDDLAADVAEFERVLSGESHGYSMDKRFIRKDGHVVHSMISVQCVRAPDGTVEHFVGLVQDIGERKRAEEAHRVAKARLDVATRGSGIGVWEYDFPDGIVEHARLERINLLELFGYDSPQTGGDQIDALDLIHPDDREHVAQTVIDYLAGNTKHYDVEHRLRHRDGSYRWVLSRGVAMRDSAGKAIRLTGTTVDITDRKHAEQRLHESERSLTAELADMARLQELSTRLVQAGDSTSLLEEIVDAAIAITAADMGNVQLLDQGTGTLKIVASRGFEAPFLEFFTAVHRGDASCGAAMQSAERVVVEDVTTSPVFAGTPALDAVLAAGVRAVQSTPLLCRSGRLVGILSTHYRVSRRPADRDLRVLDLLARQAADWIERTQHEEERKRAQKALEEDLADSRLLADISTRLIPEGEIDALLHEIIRAAIAVTDAAMGTIQLLDIGEGELRLLAWQGFEEPYVHLFHHVKLGTPSPSVSALETARREVVPDTANSPLHVGTRLGEETEAAGVRALQSTPLISRSGRPLGVISTYWRQPHESTDRALRLLDLLARQAADLIERSQVEAERQALLESERRARAESERAARLKDDFLATLSHELRSPLNAILGWAQLIKVGSGDPRKVLRGVEVIDRNARAQAQLIGDLLDLSRIVNGKMRLNVHRVDLPVVLDAAIEAVRPAAAARRIRIDSVIEPIAQPLHGDATRLQQVLWNLLSNAVKFTPEGGRVQVVLARVNSRVEILVSDTGKGIRPDFLPHVFERFRQADASAAREHGGLGIGLALVKQLTELHGGEVAAASDGEGKGSTFTVRLPLAIFHARDDEPRKHPLVPASISLDDSPLRLDGVRVLVVDDEPDTLEVIRQVLEGRRARVATACNAEDALAALEAEPFDVLLSDIGMPKRDGYDLISEIRRRGLKTPAAAVTAFARSEDRTRAMLSGYQAHMTKPLESAELLATVAALSGRIGDPNEEDRGGALH
jgi:PAS domain S-box-containing protein